MPRAALTTVGCKVNQYETQVIRERLERAGYRIVPFTSVAEVYVINTCTVTGRADQKSMYMVRRALRENREARIIVTGCQVEAEFERIQKKFPHVRVVKNLDKFKIDTLLSPEIPADSNFTIHNFSGHERAFLKIEDGCNQFCSYCRIPYVRGSKIRSRSWKEVILEVRRLLDAGYREIVLTGVNLALYGEDMEPRVNLTYLIEKVLPSLEGRGRIRLSSLEPHLIPPGILGLMSSTDALCPHLHLPLQSGDDRILTRMERGYTASQIKDLVDKFRENIPHLGVTGDVIVGFPGEKEDNFLNTCRLVKELQVHRLHVFSFSPREETPASRMRPKVQGKIKKRRSKILRNLGAEISREFIGRFAGKILPVLVESKRDRRSGCLTGYTHNYIKVLIPPDNNNLEELAGRIVPVRIREAKKGYGVGELS